jgi:hypothetical protein
MLTGAHKKQRMALALILTFLEQHHKGDETWVSFANVETKEQ